MPNAMDLESLEEETGADIFINPPSKGWDTLQKRVQSSAKTEPRELKGFIDRLVKWVTVDDRVRSSI